jgi:hypothetical protein
MHVLVPFFGVDAFSCGTVPARVAPARRYVALRKDCLSAGVIPVCRFLITPQPKAQREDAYDRRCMSSPVTSAQNGSRCPPRSETFSEPLEVGCAHNPPGSLSQPVVLLSFLTGGNILPRAGCRGVLRPSWNRPDDLFYITDRWPGLSMCYLEQANGRDDGKKARPRSNTVQ